MSKQLLFSLTKKDFIIQFTKGSGKGGQKRNKCETACRVIHPNSGAIGYSENERSQLQNKKTSL
jgi:protein subunit release factor B